jgi:sulfur relay (sulfurtransferase) complex TusBCD TusD component (DsrE family)
MEKRKLGILLSTGPSHVNAATVADLCSAAIEAGCEVYLYLIDLGVENVRDSRYEGLVGKGVKTFVCAYGCQRHGIPTSGLDERMSLCGLVVLSNIISGCDRFLAFN